MITTRIMAAAFLTCNDKVLMLKRGLHKKLGPGLWAGIGGHMELDDITNPRELTLIETCYREVLEETGICRSDIHNLKLKYITVKKDPSEVRLHYNFMGELKTEIPLPKCDEGELHWICKNDILALPMSNTVRETVKHWLLADNPCDDVYIVAVNKAGDAATICEL